MTRREKIISLESEIESFEWSPNLKPFYPLPEKLKELLELFNIDDMNNDLFIKYINETPIENLKNSIEDCNRNNLNNFRDKTIVDIKYYTKQAVKNFFLACECYEMKILNEEV